MRIAISGSTGFIGSSLGSVLKAASHDIVPILRRRTSTKGASIDWDPEAGHLDPGALEGVDCVVHLAGESIAAGRWSEAKKARILASREKGTALLCGALEKTSRKPRVLVCASAIGIYGDRGDEILSEESNPGTGFLPDVCRAWEKAAGAASRSGIRVVNARIGVVLSPSGGALAKMLTPFRFGIGGRIGDGRQFMSWIALDDLLGGILHALTTDVLRGPVNFVAPHPVTNAVFTAALGRALSRPVIFPMPAFAARLAFGEMADALLLSSARVEPKRLSASGFRFRHPSIDEALSDLLREKR